MLTPVTSAAFRRDIKRAEKRGKDLGKLRELIVLLIEEKTQNKGVRGNIGPTKGPEEISANKGTKGPGEISV